MIQLVRTALVWDTPLRAAPASIAAATALLLALLGFAPTSAQQPPIPLDTVHVAGSRAMGGAAMATRSVEILDRRHIAAIPARSVNDVLARTLGVDLLARSPAQADLSIRGSGFEQVLVMVDGVPVNDDQTGHFHLSVAVPLDAIERIEVLRGPASALYGSGAVGGVVNIVTRGAPAGAEPVASPVLTTRAQGGRWGSAAVGADARGRTASVRWRTAADYDRSDGHRPGTDHAVIQARAGVEAPLASGTLAAEAGWAARDFGAEGFYAPFDSYEETRTATATVAWQSAPSALTVHPRVSFRQHDDDFILIRTDPSVYRNIHRSRRLAGELVTRWAPGAGRVQLAGGAEASLSSLISTNLGDRREDQVAAFGELAAGDVASALATVGLRLDHHSSFGSYLSPSVAGTLRLTPALRVRASAAAGFRAPSWTDRYYSDPANIGNPDLDAEKSRTAEIGFTLEPAGHPAAAGGARGVRLDAAAFVRRADDMIDWGRAVGAADDEPWRTMNVDRATFTGVETSLTTHLANATLTLRGTLLDVDASTEPGLESKYALRPLTRTAAVELASPIVAGIGMTARAAHFHRAGGEDWHLVDLRVTHTAGRMQLFADATNVTGTRYRDVSDRPAPGRAWSVGGRVTR
ncbi:MAG TPA: TonB-dependent receptor [Longimicrobiales bacterium]|nr:TonB-dependent receptor [Longimicrobiales bacterium]